jgi:predicted nucleic acid-binding protein
MAVVVVDTNVISYIEKGDSRGPAYEKHLVGNTLVIAFMTLAELHEWANVKLWGDPRRARMAAHLKAKYAVAWSDDALCQEWARLRAECGRIGVAISVADAWVAAVATLYQVPLVTHNADDFKGVPGLQVITEMPGSSTPTA